MVHEYLLYKSLFTAPKLPESGHVEGSAPPVASHLLQMGDEQRERSFLRPATLVGSALFLRRLWHLQVWEGRWEGENLGGEGGT